MPAISGGLIINDQFKHHIDVVSNLYFVVQVAGWWCLPQSGTMVNSLHIEV